MTTKFDHALSRMSRVALVSALVWTAPPLAARAALNPGDIVIATDIGAFSDNDPGLVLVDPTTGNRTILSDNNTGSGPNFVMPEGIAVEPDGDLLVTDTKAGPGNHSAIFRVDPATGDRTILSANGIGTGDSLNVPFGIVKTSGTIYVANSNGGFGPTASVLAVDPVTGNRQIFSSQAVGTGPPLYLPIGLAVLGNTLLVADNFRLVFQVDLSTGNRTGGSAFPEGIYPEQAAGITVNSTGMVLFAGQNSDGTDHGPGVYTVNLQTGIYSQVSGALVGTGPQFGNTGPTGIGTESNGTIVLAEHTLNAILSIDPGTGNRTILSDATHGTGPSITAPQGVLVIPNVPEPSTIVLAALAGFLLVAYRHCRSCDFRSVLLPALNNLHLRTTIAIHSADLAKPHRSRAHEYLG